MIHLTKTIVDDTIFECSVMEKVHHSISDRLWSKMVAANLYPLTLRDRISEQIQLDLSYK